MSDDKKTKVIILETDTLEDYYKKTKAYLRRKYHGYPTMIGKPDRLKRKLLRNKKQEEKKS